MTGLEKMLSQIQEEADETVRSKVAEASREAEEILSQAMAEAQELGERISGQSQDAVKNHLDRAKSSADLQRRTAILRAKQEVIASMLEKAYEALEHLEPETYFAVIRRVVEQYALAEAGEIYFSKADLGRLPAGFAAELNAIAEKKGGSLTLGKSGGSDGQSGREPENGCILVYGGIEENCTFRALFAAKRERLQDVVQREVFG